MQPAEWERLCERLPRDHSEQLRFANTKAGSGIETIFAHRMRALGVEVRQQFFVRGVGYVDAVIGERLIVELDGLLFHQDQARDRRRDAVASVAGFRSLHFLAGQVTHDWGLVESAVLAAMARGDHLP